MAWTILSTEQASFETDKGSFYYVKAYVNESLSAGESYSNPNIPSSVFSGKDVSFFASDYGFTPFVSIDGNIKAIHDTNRDAYYLQFYENGTMFSEERVGGAGSFIYNYGFVCWCMLIDPDGNGILQPNPVYLSSSNMQRISYNTADSFGVVRINRDWYTSGTVTISVTQNKQAAAILNAVPVLYNWKAWDQLKGNSGQYRCELSKISNESLEDISVQVGQSSAIFNRLAPRSSIWSIIQNAALGSEIPIMWSGNNKATLTMTAGSVSGNYNLTFKLYNGGIAFYTYTTVIVYSPSTPGVNTDSNLYLSFAYDSEQLAAVFLPVIYRADGLAAGYSWGLSSGNMPGEIAMTAIYNWLLGSSGSGSGYPYDTGTEDDGGNPGGPQPGDHMPRPSVPTLSGLNAKLVTLYAPTDEQLEDIAAYLWSSDVITNIRKFVNNFADNIIALYVLPHKPENLPAKNFTVGNMTSGDITDVAYVTARFVDIDMGSVTVKTTYDSYLDFSPYTRFKIYLPGVGLMDLSADDIMCPTDPDTGTLAPVESSTISVSYTLDLLTGLLVAFVFVNGEMRYQFPGKVGYNLPITGANYTSLVTGAVSAMAGLIGAAATGGLSAPITAGAISAAVSGTVNAMKPEVHRGGNLSGDVSAMSKESPYLIYYRPNKPLLEHQELYTGFPAYKTGTISEFTGYAIFIDAHIEDISCTDAERNEIMQLLKGGVLI